MQLIATCPEEAKPALVLELEALGARSIAPGYRAVAFEASDALLYELNLKLRTASRILRVIKDVPAKSPEMLAHKSGASAGTSCSTRVMASWSRARVTMRTGRDGTEANHSQVRESIREVFEREQGVAPVVDRSEPKVVVVAHLRHGRCTLSFDTSGKSLHKRGYREPGHPAPLKETLPRPFSPWWVTTAARRLSIRCVAAVRSPSRQQ